MLCWCITFVQCVRNKSVCELMFTHSGIVCLILRVRVQCCLTAISLIDCSGMCAVCTLCMCVFCTWVLLLYCATLLSWSMRKGWKMSRWKSEGRAVSTSRSSPTSSTRERDVGWAGDTLPGVKITYHITSHHIIWSLYKAPCLTSLSFHPGSQRIDLLSFRGPWNVIPGAFPPDKNKKLVDSEGAL